MPDWEAMREDFKKGWKEGGREQAIFFAWVFPLVLTGVMLHALLTTKVPTEDLRIIVVGIVQLVVGFFCGWRLRGKRAP